MIVGYRSFFKLRKLMWRFNTLVTLWTTGGVHRALVIGFLPTRHLTLANGHILTPNKASNHGLGFRMKQDIGCSLHQLVSVLFITIGAPLAIPLVEMYARKFLYQ